MLNAIQAFDTRTFLRCFAHVQHPRSVFLSRSALCISASADGWCYLVLIPLTILLRPEAIRETLLTAVYAFGLERSLYWLLKNTFRRRRPQQALQHVNASITPADRFSLPSGHTSAAFLFVTFLCVAINPVFAALYLWAMMVGASRVILGVHFPTDVVLGALLGSSIVLLIV